MHTSIPVHNRRSLVGTTSQHASDRYYTGTRDRDHDAVPKRECPLSYMVKYRNLPCMLLIVLPRPGICLRPGVYCLSSPVYPWRVIETSVYLKPACSQEYMVLRYSLPTTHSVETLCGQCVGLTVWPYYRDDFNWFFLASTIVSIQE